MSAAGVVHRGACALFVALAGLAYPIAASPPAGRAARYVALHLLLSGVMFVAWATGRRAGTDGRMSAWAGIAARVLLLGAPAFTSNDMERYLWDGRLALAGIDPYRMSPKRGAAVLGLDWPAPPHLELGTLYPPGALALFALTALLGPDIARSAWKVIVAIASCVVVFAARALLRARDRERDLPLIALSPLLVLEGGVGAHLDIISAAALGGALALIERGRWSGAGAALGFGTLIKFLPGVAVVPLAASADRHRGTRVVVGAATIVLLGYAAAVAIGLRPLGSLFVFAAHWRFGSPIHAALAAGLGSAAAASAAALATLAGVWLAARIGREKRCAEGVLVALAVPLLVSPVVFPWYLAPLVLLVALQPSGFMLAWLTAHPLTYEVVDSVARRGVWEPAPWPLAAVVAAWGIGVTVDALRWARHRRAAVAALAAR